MKTFGVTLILIFSITLALLLGKGCDFSWVGAWWAGRSVVLNSTPEANLVEEIEKSQEDLLATGPREELRQLRAEQKKGPLSPAQMQRVTELEKKAEAARGTAEKWAAISKKVEPIKKLFGNIHYLKNGYLQKTWVFNNPDERFVWVQLEPGQYEISAVGVMNIDSRRKNRPDLLIPPAGAWRLAHAGTFPFPSLPPCGLVMQPRGEGNGSAIAMDSVKNYVADKEIVMGFTMNDFEVRDNGGDGWTVTITKQN